MSIPDDWLLYPTTPCEVEEELAESGAPDLWIRQWRAVLDRFAAGDELWEYFAAESETDHDRVDYRVGFALVREGEVIDWIEAPPTIR
jgi:hypothetical protein